MSTTSKVTPYHPRARCSLPCKNATRHIPCGILHVPPCLPLLCAEIGPDAVASLLPICTETFVSYEALQYAIICFLRIIWTSHKEFCSTTTATATPVHFGPARGWGLPFTLRRPYNKTRVWSSRLEDFEIWMHRWFFELIRLSLRIPISVLSKYSGSCYRGKKKWLQRTHDEPAGLFPCIALHALCLALFSLAFLPFLSSDRYEKSREWKYLVQIFPP